MKRINVLHECSICNYCYILKLNFSFQTELCDDFHDLMQKSTSFNNIAIVFVKKTTTKKIIIESTVGI